MPLYEHVYIARQDVSSSQLEQLKSSFKSIIEKNGGKVVAVEEWGLLNMQYKIKKNQKGHYVLLDIDASPEALGQLEEKLRHSEEILRFLTLRVKEFCAKPSPMAKKGSNYYNKGNAA